ncbi:hypothetical protein CYMTET_44487, partial [Cymbomonas tetramitiformis]
MAIANSVARRIPLPSVKGVEGVQPQLRGCTASRDAWGLSGLERFWMAYNATIQEQAPEGPCAEEGEQTKQPQGEHKLQGRQLLTFFPCFGWYVGRVLGWRSHSVVGLVFHVRYTDLDEEELTWPELRSKLLPTEPGEEPDGCRAWEPALTAAAQAAPRGTVSGSLFEAEGGRAASGDSKLASAGLAVPVDTQPVDTQRWSPAHEEQVASGRLTRPSQREPEAEGRTAKPCRHEDCGALGLVLETLQVSEQDQTGAVPRDSATMRLAPNHQRRVAEPIQHAPEQRPLNSMSKMLAVRWARSTAQRSARRLAAAGGVSGEEAPGGPGDDRGAAVGNFRTRGRAGRRAELPVLSAATTGKCKPGEEPGGSRAWEPAVMAPPWSAWKAAPFEAAGGRAASGDSKLASAGLAVPVDTQPVDTQRWSPMREKRRARKRHLHPLYLPEEAARRTSMRTARPSSWLLQTPPSSKGTLGTLGAPSFDNTHETETHVTGPEVETHVTGPEVETRVTGPEVETHV